MAAALPLYLPLHRPLHHRYPSSLRQHRRLPPSLRHHQQQVHLSKTSKTPNFITAAYITGPASDAIISTDDPKIEDSDSGPEPVQRFNAINLSLLLKLISRHKLRVIASIVSLICCTTCTLSMPLLSGT